MAVKMHRLILPAVPGIKPPAREVSERACLRCAGRGIILYSNSYGARHRPGFFTGVAVCPPWSRFRFSDHGFLFSGVLGAGRRAGAPGSTARSGPFLVAGTV